MAQFKHNLVEVARNSRGLSQKDLSSMLPKLNQPNLSKVERGELTPSKYDVVHIATALGYPEDFFYREETKMPVPYIYYRKRATLPAKVHNRILAETHQIILSGIDSIIEDVDLKEYAKYSFNVTDGWTPEDAAHRMREILKLPPDKPVTDIVKRIEDLGIVVFFYNSPSDKFDGLTAYTNKDIPVIFVNKNSSRERIKYTLVHELFHLVLHIPFSIEPWRETEKEADLATSEFFIPKAYSYKDLQNLSYRKLGDLKSYWGISKAAIVRRAKELNYISKETYTYLNIELGRRGERKNETGYVEIDEPRTISAIIGLLKNELNYSDQDLADKMAISLVDYHNLFEGDNRNHIRLRVIRQGA